MTELTERELKMRITVKRIMMFLAQNSGLEFEDAMLALNIATDVLRKLGKELTTPEETNEYIIARIKEISDYGKHC